MVTLNCASFKINIFQIKFKTSFERNEFSINNDLWCQIVPNKRAKNVENSSLTQTDNTETSSINQDELLNEFNLAVLRQFMEANSLKINKLIEMNLQMCVGEKNDHYRVVHLLYSWQILFLNIELNIFYTNEYKKAILSDSQTIKNDEKNLVCLFRI